MTTPAERKRQTRKRVQWVQRHANALAAENGGKVDVEELDRRLKADLEAHPELFGFMGAWIGGDND